MDLSMRILLYLFSAVLWANGIAMLIAGAWWYETVPGVMQTGPYNPHFVRDIGMAYLSCAMALIWWGLEPVRGRSAAIMAAVFLALHAGIHLFDSSCASSIFEDLKRDFAGVYLPPILMVALIWHQTHNRSVSS